MNLIDFQTVFCSFAFIYEHSCVSRSSLLDQHHQIWCLWAPCRLTPSNTVVIEVLASFRAKHLHYHTVKVETLHQHPGEGTQEEEMKQDGHDLTGKLMGQRPSANLTTTLSDRSSSVELCPPFQGQNVHWWAVRSQPQGWRRTGWHGCGIAGYGWCSQNWREAGHCYVSSTPPDEMWWSKDTHDKTANVTRVMMRQKMEMEQPT